MSSSKISVGSNAPPTWAVLLAPLPFIKHVIKYKYDYPKTVADPWRSPEEIYKDGIKKLTKQKQQQT